MNEPAESPARNTPAGVPATPPTGVSPAAAVSPTTTPQLELNLGLTYTTPASSSDKSKNGFSTRNIPRKAAAVVKRVGTRVVAATQTVLQLHLGASAQQAFFSFRRKDYFEGQKTKINGEDIDIPAYKRYNIPLNPPPEPATSQRLLRPGTEHPLEREAA